MPTNASRMPSLNRIPVISKIPNLTEHARTRLASISNEIELVSVDVSTLKDLTSIDSGTKDLLSQAQVILGDPSSVAPLLSIAPNVQWVQSTFAGVESILLQPRRDFTLTRAGGIMGLHMAQYVLGWVIAKERKFQDAISYQAKREYRAKEMRYRHFQDVTVGILGLGDIGTTIGKLVASAGFRVLGLKRTSSPNSNELIDPIQLTSHLDDILQQSHYIVNVLPSTTYTRNLLSGDILKACETNKACFINVGRGDVVDEASLVHALNERWLSSAVLDVFATEPLPVDSALWDHPLVTLTPHVAALSMPEDVAAVFSRNLAHYRKEETLEYAFEWGRGY